jgi:hypothetical protein
MMTDTVGGLNTEIARLKEEVSALKRGQTAAVEKALAEHRATKTRELDNLRARMDEKRAEELQGLQDQVCLNFHCVLSRSISFSHVVFLSLLFSLWCCLSLAACVTRIYPKQRAW